MNFKGLNNNERIQFSTPVVSAKVVSNGKGSYTISCAPTEHNPTGRYNMTRKQLTQIAGSMGLTSYRTLLSVLAKGGCVAHFNASICLKGETTEDGAITYEKDWVRIDNVSTVFELSDKAEAFVDKVQLESAMRNESESAGEDTDRADRLRAMLSLQAGKPVTKSDDDVDAEDNKKGKK